MDALSSISPLDPAPVGAGLTRRQKAAVIAHMLVSGGADLGIRGLSVDQQTRMVADLAALRFVDRATLAATVAEFASELDGIGLHFPRDPGKVLAQMGDNLSLDAIEAVLADAGEISDMGDGPWTALAGLGVDALTAILAEESHEVCAILLSKLPPDRSSELLAEIAPERAAAIASAFPRTGQVTPAAVARIGLALGRQTNATPDTAFANDPVDRVAAILNTSIASVRTALLEQLDATDASFAALVRAAVFTFENIPERIAPRDVPAILRMVDSGILVTAFGGATGDAATTVEFIYANISPRLADQYREEIEEKGDIPLSDAEEAMSVIVNAIRAMEEKGEISFVTPDPE